MHGVRTVGIRQQIDPDGTLPEISVRPLFKTEKEGGYHAYEIGYKKMHVGRMTVFRSWHETDNFSYISVKQGVRKGLGLAAYTWAIEHSHEQERAFASGDSVSVSARRIWDILGEKGDVEIVEPFKEVTLNDGSEDYIVYLGYYFIAASPAT